MLIWKTPIFDRTQSDVDRVLELNEKVQAETATAEEIAEWNTDLKGAFNLTDMGRLVNNITILDDVLQTQLTLPETTMFPNASWWTLLLTDVEAIRNAYITYSDTPATPNRPINNFTKVNTIEKILYDVYTILNSMFFHYCGESYYAGDSIGLLL